MASAVAERTTVRTYRDYSRPWWRRALLTREIAIVAAVIGVYVVAAVAVPNFSSPITLTYLMLDIAAILLIALPMTMIIVTGEIDLSVASVVGLSSVTFGTLYQAGLPIPLAMLAALAVGAIAGFINGFLVTVVGLPSLAVTIGTLALFRGLAVGILGTTAVTGFPDAWTDLATSKIPGTPIPSVMIVFVILAIGFGLLLHATPFGRGVFAIGQSSEAARFSGVRVERTKLLLFVASGTIAALAGIYYTLRYGSARGDNATGLELSVIAAVLLGGVSIFGGRGALHGVIAGVFLIGILASALRLANVTSDVINIITGTLLVVSVVSPSLLAWARSSWARHRGNREAAGGTTPAPAVGHANPDAQPSQHKEKEAQ
ncbi:ABC transporter permease [Demequina sp. B12]|uniref:ABC transporter permease n=1 Tax=Demequina sp. B12 TaxID=2992757 RepID=UPI00237C3D42|nr:ABC transporter permease [Demequina sp. B12]MDE0572684.1 ABC transporter permease [Demequina sp. B12]